MINDKTPVKFSVSNDEPLTDDWGAIAVNMAKTVIERAIRERDGTVILNITPRRIDCEYTPAEPTEE